MPFALSSTAFANNHPIPAIYSCEGENISPPLAWHDAPSYTQSFVLIVEDPDAPGGVFRHWGVYDLPGGKTELPRGAKLPNAKQAVNDFNHAHYDGPCPPPGGAHHYHFRLAALNRAMLTLPPHAKVAALWQAAQPYIIAETELVGTFKR